MLKFTTQLLIEATKVHFVLLVRIALRSNVRYTFLALSSNDDSITALIQGRGAYVRPHKGLCNILTSNIE